MFLKFRPVDMRSLAHVYYVPSVLGTRMQTMCCGGAGVGLGSGPKKGRKRAKKGGMPKGYFWGISGKLGCRRAIPPHKGDA